MTTMTIELDDELLARIRKLASIRNVTVPQMIQRLIDVRASEPPLPDELSPNVRAETGIAPPMADEEVEKTLEQEMLRRFGGE
jgi:hypothetical protein